VGGIILRGGYAVGGMSVGDVSFAVAYAFTVRGAFAVRGMAMGAEVVVGGDAIVRGGMIVALVSLVARRRDLRCMRCTCMRSCCAYIRHCGVGPRTQCS
jgi:hypothetical protein